MSVAPAPTELVKPFFPKRTKRTVVNDPLRTVSNSSADKLYDKVSTDGDKNTSRDALPLNPL